MSFSRRSLARPFKEKNSEEKRYYTHNQKILLPKHISERNRITVKNILLVPETLGTADASFMTELESGQMGLSGHFINIDPVHESPFDIKAPTADFERDLHDFRWLRHLEKAAETSQDWENHPAFFARKFVASWIGHSHNDRQCLSEPQVFARRVRAWMSHSRLLLEGADNDFRTLVLDSMGEQLYTIAQDHNDLLDPVQRLHFLTVLLFAGLTITGQEDLYDHFKGDFSEELKLQINEDGFHQSHNPKALKNLLMEFVPLQHCIRTRDKLPPAGFDDVLARMMRMLRFLRLGDGRLPRFCGTGATYPDEITALLSYDDSLWEPRPESPASGMFRLQADNTIVMIKTGAAPLLEFSNEAHADCLSFEMIVGPYPLIVNCGTPRHDDNRWRHNARLTAAQSVLSIEEKDSAHFVQLDPGEGKKRIVSGLIGPEGTKADLDFREDNTRLIASHEGYLQRFGVRYRRVLQLEHNGMQLAGEEMLLVDGPYLPGHTYAVHFHLHPDVKVQEAGENSVLLTLHDGEVWRFTCTNSRMIIADSVYLAMQHGPLKTQQIVLAGDVRPGMKARWTLQQEDFLKRQVFQAMM